jgi:nitroimidazol reductase NimA-like FMN-containing flavoprotein (pyridoxamine 5'-phosphate oxidase superfamily)
MDTLTRAEIDELLGTQLVGRIGCHAEGRLYVVPVIYTYDNGAIYVVSVEGQKTKMMRANPVVCFEVDEYEEATGSWRSAIVDGRFEELEGESATHAVALLAESFRRRRGSAKTERAPRGGGRTMVAFRILVESVSGRALRRH